MKVFTLLSSLFWIYLAASPTNIAKITTPITLKSTIAFIGFEGINSRIIVTTFFTSLILLSPLPKTIELLPSLNTAETTKPTIELIATIPNVIISVNLVNFLTSVLALIFTITLIIETNTNGTINILIKSINPFPNNEYHVVVSATYLIFIGSSLNPEYACIPTPRSKPIAVDNNVLFEELTLFFAK